MLQSYNEFVDYVWSFYNTEDGLYPIQGITREMVIEASWIYLQICTYPSFPDIQWGDGDTSDREHVRDILLEKYHLSSIN